MAVRKTVNPPFYSAASVNQRSSLHSFSLIEISILSVNEINNNKTLTLR